MSSIRAGGAGGDIDLRPSFQTLADPATGGGAR
jgi:hypothetical protein